MQLDTGTAKMEGVPPPSSPEPSPAPTPLERAVARVGDRWCLLVIAALLEGPMRFGELQEAVGAIAPNVLSQRLKHLEREGVVVAQPYSDRPVRLAYRLTGTGQDLAGALRLLAQWGAGSDESEGVLHRSCGTPMEPRWWCPTCERAVEGDAGGTGEDVRYA